MAYMINDACISCGACEAECPVSCISAGDDKYVIDADACIECGSCSFICPARRPLLQSIRVAKKEIMTLRRNKTTK
jgi:ferredoxin